MLYKLCPKVFCYLVKLKKTFVVVVVVVVLESMGIEFLYVDGTLIYRLLITQLCICAIHPIRLKFPFLV